MLPIVLFEEGSLCLNDRVQKLFCFFTHKFEQHLFSVFSSILSFDLDFIIRPFLTIRGPIASFGVGMVEFNNCFRVSSFIPITFVFLVWLDSNYILEFWVCMVMVVGGWIPAIA